MNPISAAIIPADEGKQITFAPIDNGDLAAYQRVVGGYVELVRFLAGHMYVNEEGTLRQLPINRRASVVAGRPIVGDVLVTGADDADADADLPSALRTPFALLNAAG